MTQGTLILAVDDEPRILSIIRMNLELEGFRVEAARGGREALEKATQALPDLIVQDVKMPLLDGFETLRALRQASRVPVIMLTVKAEESDRIRGLDLGADDYLAKPFSPHELAARIRAVLRRTGQSNPAHLGVVVVDEDLTINFDTREVWRRGSAPVTLRPTEYRLLYHLVRNAGRLQSHETLLARVWGPEYRDEDHYLRLYITYLRQKIEPDPAQPRYIFTERGLGYRFRDLPPRDEERGITA